LHLAQPFILHLHSLHRKTQENTINI